ncbi:MAG: HAD family phosphatase [Candidatus Eremiobacteraeota bacterium]|nr:HAD family phosphatase [Candidatus Eremiobacteraeota bacterium]MCW5870460.1 HAD family phosphatase [Candidatus Eremiobacteraeota bacterium]
MAVQAVLFDIGGVLIHANLESYAERGARVFKSNPEAVRAAVQPRVPKLEKGEISSEDFWKEVGEVLWSKGQGVLPDPHHFKGLWKQLMADSLKLDNQVLKLCWNLRAKVMVGALSNTIKEHAEYLADLGYYQPFRPCVLSCLVGQRKPDKSIYQLAAKQTGKSIGKCLFVDDSEVNCQAAKAAGMKVHHFTGLYPLVTELSKYKLL